MGDQQNRAFIAPERDFHTLPCVDVQVIGGFIQHQQVRSGRQQFRQRYPYPLAFAQLFNALEDIIARKQQARQQGSDFALIGSADAPDLLQNRVLGVLVLMFLRQITDPQSCAQPHIA